MKIILSILIIILLNSCKKKEKIKYYFLSETRNAEMKRDANHFEYFFYENDSDTLERAMNFIINNDSVFFYYDSTYYDIINKIPIRNFLFIQKDVNESKYINRNLSYYLFFYMQYSNFYGMAYQMSLTCKYYKKKILYIPEKQDSVISIVYAGLYSGLNESNDYDGFQYKYLILYWSKENGFIGSGIYGKEDNYGSKYTPDKWINIIREGYEECLDFEFDFIKNEKIEN